MVSAAGITKLTWKSKREKNIKKELNPQNELEKLRLNLKIEKKIRASERNKFGAMNKPPLHCNENNLPPHLFAKGSEVSPCWLHFLTKYQILNVSWSVLTFRI